MILDDSGVFLLVFVFKFYLHTSALPNYFPFKNGFKTRKGWPFPRPQTPRNSCELAFLPFRERPRLAGRGALTRLRSRSRSSRMAFMVALVLFSSSSLLHSMAVRLSFSSLSPASSFSQRDRSSARLGYRSRPSTPSISSTVWKTEPQDKWVTLEKGKGRKQARQERVSTEEWILQPTSLQTVTTTRDTPKSSSPHFKMRVCCSLGS